MESLFLDRLQSRLADGAYRRMVKKEKTSSKNILLVEFKAPKELVELFDQESRYRFSSRSEALRSLMRAFLQEASDRRMKRVDM